VPDSRRVGSPPERPLLVFDGNCGFCRFWIAWWRHRAASSVDVEPSQQPDISRRFPEITRDRFARAVQLIEVDGRVSEGAEAVFRALALGGRRTPLWAYQSVPGVAPVTERAYRLIANHRSFWAGVTTLLWGRTAERSTYGRATWLFLRVLGIVYLIAFWSLGAQILGLSGHDGILPADRYMAGARDLAGIGRFWAFPTLAWASVTDTTLQLLCIAGAAMASLLVAGIFPVVVLPLLWLTYLSLLVVCREFLTYQWDTLLLETGFLAMFLAPLARRERLRALTDPPRLAVGLLLWLLFRLMVGSGAVKLTSGDPTWASLTALAFHFETQPIPTPIAWYAHQLPLWFLKGATVAVFAIEIGVPLLVLAPRRLRALAFVPLAALQALIALTGNYAFFNLLTAGLCLFLLDDAALGNWGAVAPGRIAGRVRRVILVAAAVVTIPVSASAFAGALGIGLPGAPFVDPLANAIAPFRSVNAYGLFAIMTPTRPEIVLEGSEDGAAWVEYEFKHKPGDVRRRPPWVAPHQPRLDWQMWFAAFSRFDDERWFQNFCVRLLEADRTVLRLLERDPFEGRRPRYLRAVLYRYRFSDATTRRRDGVWWRRERLGEYSPTLSLSPPAQTKSQGVRTGRLARLTE
jgi:predicted DCC family thiol-disulfide oxidoreductase YuxK